MGVFSGLREAKGTQGGLYFQPGNYVVQINKIKMQDSQVGGRKFFVVETRVVEATQTDKEIAPNGVDTEPSWLVELPGQYPDLSLGNVKSFLTAAFGSLAATADEEGPAEEEIGEDEAELATSEDNPLVGVFLTAKAFHKPTKKGGTFTRINWGVPENLEELAA